MRLRSKNTALPLLCYAAALILWLIHGTLGIVSDAGARAQGKMEEQTLYAADFALVDLQPGGTGEGPQTLQTTSGDPQMILEDVSGQTIRTMQVYAEYEGDAREMCLYYTAKAGQDYSQDRRVFPAVQSDGSYLYTLPRGALVSLRLDPCSPDANKTVEITLEKITLNTATSAVGELIPSWYQLFCLILYPGLLAAALDWLLAIIQTVKNK